MTPIRKAIPKVTSWSPRPPSALRSGGRVAVVGGGPAGSAFAIFALDFARQAGLDIEVTIFEPRDFDRGGPWGCNMCAGLIPVRALRSLDQLGLEVPERVIRDRIQQYTLHTGAGRILVPQPDPDGDVCSVYRGHGPRDAPLWPDNVSFDGFLLAAARSRGATVIHERVKAIDLCPYPTVSTAQRSSATDLVVLATGVNQHPVAITGLDYRAPTRQQMAQTEFCPGLEAVQATLGAGVHVFLPTDGSFTFGTLVPKGPCVNASLLGPRLPPGILAHFLAQPEVSELLPDVSDRSCGCRPHIAVGVARPLYADGFVAVGDAGITRLYKNGIGAALSCARQAAFAAVTQGVAAADFRAHYAPLCREIALDNRAGRVLFTFTHVFQGHRRLTRPHMSSIAAEQALPPAKRPHSRLLWGMFTGTQSYRSLLALAMRPDLHIRLLGHFLAESLSGLESLESPLA